MKQTNQFKFLALLVALAYVLSACTGVAPAANANQGQDDQPQQVVFTGTVEAMGGGEWTISGQVVTVTGTTTVDATIMVGTNVRVEAVVDQNGVVTAVSIETAGADDPNANANANDSNGNDDNGNDANANANTNGDDNSNSNANGNDNGNGNDSALTGTETEVTGKVDAISSTSITIGGLVYDLSTKTEFKGVIAVGDMVKAHVITSAEGKQTIREIEKLSGTSIGGNSNDNGNDDHGGNSNSSDDNGNSNDDNGGNSNGNDDHGGNSNSSDDNGNSNDSNSNGSDDNGNGGNDNGGNGNGNG